MQRIEKLKTIGQYEAISKLALWFVLSLAISLVFLGDFWANLWAMVSPSRLLGQTAASPWGVLTLCLIWVYLKRQEIWREMNLSTRLARLWRVPLGLGVVAGAVLMPASQDFLAFQAATAALGAFVSLFGRAARLPAILLGIYGFAVSFPLLIQRFAEQAYSSTAIVPLMGLLTALGYPVESQGQWLSLTSASGEPIRVAITLACAGPATMAVFIAIFALMMLDMPLSPKKAAALFLLGAAGTWFQNLVRLTLLMLIGYYWGKDALWAAHLYTLYGLFPAWYLLFAYLYLRQVGSAARERWQQQA